jgi:hypothetical protein
VRIGNQVTIKQGGTFHEAAEASLAWISRQAWQPELPALRP